MLDRTAQLVQIWGEFTTGFLFVLYWLRKLAHTDPQVVNFIEKEIEMDISSLTGILQVGADAAAAEIKKKVPAAQLPEVADGLNALGTVLVDIANDLNATAAAAPTAKS